MRDREYEFDVNHATSKAQTLHELTVAIAMVITTLETQREADWATNYVADGVDDVHDRFSIFLRCAVHFHHHIGHMSYVKDELLRQKVSGIAGNLNRER